MVQNKKTKPVKKQTKPAKKQTKPVKKQAKPVKEQTKLVKKQAKPVKEQTKPTKKQEKKQPAKPKKAAAQTKRRQTAKQREAQLLQEMAPLTSGRDMNQEEEFLQFATQVMIDAAALYDEPEFEDMLLEPADSLYTLLSMYGLFVPPPERLEQLSEEEQEDFTSEASIRALAEFVTPELQKDVLAALEQCRRRLEGEEHKDKLAQAAATEFLLRGDDRAEIWATCGLLHRMLESSLELAHQMEDEKDKVLALAQAIQPDIKDIYDLEEGTPAYEAFWTAVDNNPELADYVSSALDIQQDIGMSLYSDIDGDLAEELFDPDELSKFFEGLSEGLKAHGLLIEAPDQTPIMDTLDSVTRRAFAAEYLPQLVKTQFPPERFQELLKDLQEIGQEEQDFDIIIPRARALYATLSDPNIPYWENGALAHFLGNAAISHMSYRDEWDEDEDDEWEDEEGEWKDEEGEWEEEDEEQKDKGAEGAGQVENEA